MTAVHSVPAKRRHRQQETCTCKAYPFPHRAGSGKCVADDPGPFCGCCGQPCSPRQVDNGIGAYEYWGSKGVDVRIDTESDCCDAPVFSDAALTKEYEYEPDYD